MDFTGTGRPVAVPGRPVPVRDVIPLLRKDQGMIQADLERFLLNVENCPVKEIMEG